MVKSTAFLPGNAFLELLQYFVLAFVDSVDGAGWPVLPLKQTSEYEGKLS